jgi:ADP-ribosyl-[dinitrogen reductase] hydrolase
MFYVIIFYISTLNEMPNLEIKSALFGFAIGDSLDVPVEFKSRSYLKAKPLTRMIGYGTHDQPPGTFSDDASLAFCLTEALTTGYDLQKIADLFIAWMYEGYWTPWGDVFDKGIATTTAIGRVKLGIRPDLAGGMEELDNSNGSLMRILPLLFYLRDKPIEERFHITKEVSSLTHAHIRSVIACFYYLEFARLIGKSESKFEIHTRLQQEIALFLETLSINPSELPVSIAC